jgi:plasmid stabilization system protein ParE
MNYLVKARARLDLNSHWRYIARDNLPAADRLLDAAEETFQLIGESPDIGSQRSFRKLVGIRSDPCLSALIETMRDQTRIVDLTQVNRVLIQSHWRKDGDQPLP